METPLDRLARLHHARQARIALRSVRETRDAFRGVDVSDQRSVGQAVGQAVPTLLQQRLASARAARSYYREHRLATIGSSAEIPVDPDAQDDAEERIRSSLWILARGRRRLEMEKDDGERELTPRARSRLGKELAGAATRHTLDGGRTDLRAVVLDDNSAMGWVRITSRDDRVCYFCVMLASREDYKGSSFERSDPRFAFGDNPLANAKVHDGCRCSLRPVMYGEGTPEHTRIAQRLWYDLSEDGTPREVLNSFRRNYDAMIRSQTSVWQAA